MNADIAVILAGGRSARMGTDKARVQLGGDSLLQRAVDACQGCGRIVIVAPADPASVSPRTEIPLVRTYEDPPFGGPVAGVAAALDALPDSPAEARILLLSVDLVRPGEVVAALMERAGQDDWTDGLALVDGEGWKQPMAALYRRSALARALSRLDTVRDVSMQRMIRELDVTPLTGRPGLTDDVDTPEQLAALDAEPPRLED